MPKYEVEIELLQYDFDSIEAENPNLAFDEVIDQIINNRLFRGYVYKEGSDIPIPM